MSTLNDMVEDEGPLSQINIVPFVDIVLVLLVIFMLTSATITKASFKVDLPKAAAASGKVTSTINLLCTKEGDLFVNGEAVSDLAKIAEIVRREVAQNAETQAVIAADQGVAYGRVVELLDVVKGNGITTFALDVERRQH